MTDISKVIRTCETCGKEFEARLCDIKKGHARFCSHACRGKWVSENQKGKNNPSYKGKIEMTCAECGKTFSRYPSQKDRKFCSQACYHKNRGKRQTGENNPYWRGSPITVKCQICGKKFTAYPSCIDKYYNGRYCSNECKNAAKRGEKSHWWKGGISTEREVFDNRSAWKVHMRKKIFDRDNGTCTICGHEFAPDEIFEVHHIVPFEIEDLRLEERNLMLVCFDCHRWIHSTSNTKSEHIMSKEEFIAEHPEYPLNTLTPYLDEGEPLTE